MESDLTAIEEEAILLRAVYNMINDMVNYVMLSLSGSDPDSKVTFKSDVHLRLFNIMLVDFLSTTARKGPIRPISYMSALQTIAEKPNFDEGNSVQAFQSAVAAFAEWLDTEVTVDTYLPSIDTEANLKLSRGTFIKMCGNISKHNFLRSVTVAEQLQKILQRHSIQVSVEDALLALEDFRTKFHGDVIAYHGSTIAQFLNDVRWGIYEYLRPEFRRSYTRIPDDPRGRYEYRFPLGITAKFPRDCYWNLMNDVRGQPFLRRFETTRFLKMHY
jgi:hypothetical protein